ncbi:MAG: 5-formyltetrahydrofolate cyclo-ligase [Saprospiraceae bacterium]
MNIVNQKLNLRKEMIAMRNKIDPLIKKDYDSWICSELENMIHKNNFKIIHSFIPMPSEINVIPLLQRLLDQGLKIICPKVLPKSKMENRILSSLNDLETGVLRTQHPSAANIYHGDYDLIIVPGLAYDKNLNRLGYGGGYYDNFLNGLPRAFNLGIFYPFQLVESVPIEAHDHALNNILSKEF